ncbi:hypothetical protein GCM10027570_30140 [Streptomonospora sediminis]
MQDKKARFEDRLLSELKREVALNAAQEHHAARSQDRSALGRLVTMPRVGMALAGCAAVAAGFVLVPGGGASPAYAVEEKPDGTVRVELQELSLDKSEQQKLAADLRDHGVVVEIRNPETGTRCNPAQQEGGITFLRGTGQEVPPEDTANAEAMKVDKAELADNPEKGKPFGGKDGPWNILLKGDNSLVMENIVRAEGEPHISSFYVVNGAPEPCVPLSVDEVNPLGAEPGKPAADQPESGGSQAGETDPQDTESLDPSDPADFKPGSPAEELPESSKATAGDPDQSDR